MTVTEAVDTIRREMERQNMTQRALAERAGVTDSTICYWLSRRRGLTLTHLIPVLDALGLKLTVERK